MRRISISFVIAVATCGAGAWPAGPTASARYREGPVPAKTGGFGEDTCRVCHFDNPLNDPGGSVGLEGVPATYAPGEDFELTVAVDRPAITRGGFELSARFADGPSTGRQAGRFRAADTNTRVITSADGTVEYAQHTAAGSRTAEGHGRWAVVWTAPDPAFGPVVFHVAANASNDDASALGDFVYTAAISSQAPPGP